MIYTKVKNMTSVKIARIVKVSKRTNRFYPTFEIIVNGDKIITDGTIKGIVSQGTAKECKVGDIIQIHYNESFPLEFWCDEKVKDSYIIFYNVLKVGFVGLSIMILLLLCGL